MGDYKKEQDRIFAAQELARRDQQHRDNLEVLSKHIGVPSEQVMEFIRPKSTVSEIEGPDANQTVSTSDFSDAPTGLSDPELAEWAAQRVSN